MAEVITVTLKELGDRKNALAGRVKAPTATSFINGSMTVKNSRKLAGNDINYYRCSGCSWTTSGTR